jgi:hypothetical protein
MKNTTVGLSPKARDAGLITAVATLVALAIQWAITGEFDRAELVTTLTGLGSALVAFLAAYRADPGTIQRVPATTRRGGRTTDGGYADPLYLLVVLVLVVIVVWVLLRVLG